MGGIQAKARLAGLAYLGIFVAAPFAEMFVRSSATVSGDAAATAANILAHADLWRLALVSELANAAFDTIVAVSLYELLKPVGPTLSLMAAVFRLILVVIAAFKTLLHIAPLYLLTGAVMPGAFSSEQVQALAYLSLQLHDKAYSLSLFFFGIHLLLVGWLVARANFLPRLLGWMLALAGGCYLVGTIVGALALPLQVFPWILLPGFIAELSFALWLSARGINVEKWRAQAAASASQA